MSPERAAKLAGFDVYPFIKKTKNHLRMGKVQLQFTRGVQASAEHDGSTCVISLPTKATVKKRLGLDNATTVAKQKASISEELSHCTCHETDHNTCVVHNTIKLMKKFLTPQEQKMPYIKMKIEGLKSAKKQGK